MKVYCFAWDTADGNTVSKFHYSPSARDYWFKLPETPKGAVAFDMEVPANATYEQIEDLVHTSATWRWYLQGTQKVAA